LKKENFNLKMKIFFYEDGMKYIETKVISLNIYMNYNLYRFLEIKIKINKKKKIKISLYI